MWPWEHILFAYLVYSPYRRIRSREPPSGPAVFALSIGSLLPDVIDKPLAWQYGIAPSGYGPAHSVFVAIPVSILVFLFVWKRGYARIGAAFGFGYVLHLIGDVIPISIRVGRVYYEHLLWPFVNPTPVNTHESFGAALFHHVGLYHGDLVALDPSPMLVIQLGVAVAGLLIWGIDRFPGVGTSIRLIQRSIPGAGD